MIVKNYHVAEEKYICVCVQERDHKFFTSLGSMKVFDSTVCMDESESRPLIKP